MKIRKETEPGYAERVNAWARAWYWNVEKPAFQEKNEWLHTADPVEVLLYMGWYGKKTKVKRE